MVASSRIKAKNKSISIPYKRKFDGALADVSIKNTKDIPVYLVASVASRQFILKFY